MIFQILVTNVYDLWQHLPTFKYLADFHKFCLIYTIIQNPVFTNTAKQNSNHNYNTVHVVFMDGWLTGLGRAAWCLVLDVDQYDFVKAEIVGEKQLVQSFIECM